MKSPGPASAVNSSFSPHRMRARPLTTKITLSRSPWWWAPVLALGWITTVPAQIFSAPARAWLIAVARDMPGVWAVLGSRESPGTTFTPWVFQSIASGAEWAWSWAIAEILLREPDCALRRGAEVGVRRENVHAFSAGIFWQCAGATLCASVRFRRASGGGLRRAGATSPGPSCAVPRQRSKTKMMGGNTHVDEGIDCRLVRPCRRRDARASGRHHGRQPAPYGQRVRQLAHGPPRLQ